ncbi:unnamed protein product [Alopecurus aequalis]
MEAPRLTPGAVVAIWDLPDGPAMYKPVLQVADLRLVTAKKTAAEAAAASTQQQAERFRMLLSDGVHSQQSVLATALNHLVRDGALRPGSIVQLQDITCNNFQGRRILIVVKLDVLQSECEKIGTPKMYDKTLPGEQEANLPPNTAQTNYAKYSGDPGMLGSACAPRMEQRANNMSYGGPYSGVHGTMDPSICQTVQHGPNNVLSGGSYGTMQAPYTMKANVVQPQSQQPLLNSHQNQRSGVPGTAGGFGPPGNIYGRPAQSLYQQPPPTYRHSGPVGKNEATTRVVPISALNLYQRTWTIKARVTAKTHVRKYTNAKGPGKLFSVDLLDAHGGEIRATCFGEVVDQLYDQIEVDKVYMISRGSLKPANKKFNSLNNDYELNLELSTSIEVCSGDDSSIPRQQFNFRPISEIANMDINAMVDLLAIVTSVSPCFTIMRKNGEEVQKRVLQLKDMSRCSVDITFWGDFCKVEGQQLQSLCDSGSNPILALKSGRVGEYNGRTVGTISSSLLKVNPDFSDAERLTQWYITEGKKAAWTSLSGEMSSMGRTDVRKTTAQIKNEKLGQSEKPSWITVKGAISHINTDSFCYPACAVEANGKRCYKKVTNNGDGMWYCETCEQGSQECEYRYLLVCQIQDHTGTTYATAFEDTGKEIIGLTAHELFKIKNEDQDDDKFAGIIQQVRYQQYLFKLKVKEEIYNDEPRVKSNIMKAEKIDDTSKECRFLQGAIDSFLAEEDLGSNPGVNLGAAVNAGFTNSEGRQSVLTSNHSHAMNLGGPNQFGQQLSASGRMPTTPSATRHAETFPAATMDMQRPAAGGGYPVSSYGSSAANTSPTTRYGQTCSGCGSNGHNIQNCPAAAMNMQRPAAGGGYTPSSYCSSVASASSGLCHKCHQPGHFARDCPGQAAGPQHQAYGNVAASGGYNRQSYAGNF